MQVGDLVLYQGQRWLVHRLDKMTRTVFLYNQVGATAELPDMHDRLEPDTIKVVAKPSLDWKVIPAPIKSGAGPFVKFTVPGPLGRKARELRPWLDWIPSDPFRDGGSVFVRPGISLPSHTVVIFTHQNGVAARIKLPRILTTVAKTRAVPKVATVPENRFSRMLDDDDL